MILKTFILAVLVLFLKFSLNTGAGITVPNPYFHFPYDGPFMGILTAVAVPLLDAPVPGNMFISFNFEASYSLPQNDTEFTWPPIIGSSSSRQYLYSFFEQKLESHGYPGKDCLLRAICEGSEYSTASTGVLGDIVHVVLSPSSSLNTNLSREYEQAEHQARQKGKCKIYKKKCKFSLLNLVSWVGKILPADLSRLIKLPLVK